MKHNTNNTLKNLCALGFFVYLCSIASTAFAHVGHEQGQCSPTAGDVLTQPQPPQQTPPHITQHTPPVHAHPPTNMDQWSSLALLSLLLTLLGVTALSGRRFITQPSKRSVGTSLTLAACFLTAYASCKSTATPPATSKESTIEQMKASFELFPNVQLNHDETYLYVGSNGFPDHSMMVGITNWQQQIPIPQEYTGDNAWSIPRQPVFSNEKLSITDNFMKGAIAIAVNGIPIFNPLNNRGEDAFLIGELDQWGGHCGRADDYHYHLPPLHLQEKVNNMPIAWALDGFPVYGDKEPDGTAAQDLDEFHGHLYQDQYHYHGTTTYPYMIGAMRGVVQFNSNTRAPENEIDPQAKSTPVRPALEPLRDAAITEFTKTGALSYTLTYTLNNETYKIQYEKNDSKHTYVFVEPNGTERTETYP